MNYWGSEKQEDLRNAFAGTATEAANMRGSVLIDAHKTINGERQSVYGSPENSFALIAEYWNTYMNSSVRTRFMGEDVVSFEAIDVAMMMTLFKIAREANQHKRDNILDAAGYLGIYADMQEVAK